MVTGTQRTKPELLAELSELQALVRDYRAIAETIRSLVYVVDSDGFIKYANAAVRERLGYSAEELSTKSISDIHPVECLEDAEHVVAELLRGERTVCTVPLLAKDGSHVPVVTEVTHCFLEGEKILVAVSQDVTEQHHVENELTPLSRALQLTADAVTITDADGNVVSVNAAMLRLHGFDDKREILGQPALRLVAPADRKRVQAEIAALLETGSGTCEYEILRRDGSTRRVETSVAVMRNAAGTADRIVAITGDVTERQAADRELRESKEVYAAFMSNAPGLVVFRDLDGRVVDANAAFLDALGKPKEDVLGTTILELFPREEHANKALAHHRRVICENEPSTSQLKFAHADGSIHHYTVTRFPLRNADSVTVGVGAIATDITERQIAEEDLRRSEATARGLLDAQDDVILLVEKDGYIVDANKAMMERLGIPIEQAVGSTIYALFPPDVARHWCSFFDEVLDTKSPTEFQDERAGRAFNTVMYPILDAGREVEAVAIVSRDVTQQRRAEEALRQSERRYRAISDLSSDYAYAYRVKPNGEFENEWVTGALTRLTGFTREEVRNAGGWESLIHPEDLHLALERARSLLSNEPATVEYRITTKDNEVRWMQDRARPTWDEVEGRVTRVEGTVQDISASRFAEQALRAARDELEQRVAYRTTELSKLNETLQTEVLERKSAEQEVRVFKDIADNANYGLIILNLDGTIGYVNHYGADTHGYAVDELVGKHVSVIHTGAHKDTLDQLLTRLRQDGALEAAETWSVHKDGTKIPMLVTGLVITNEQGSPVCMAGTGIDLTEHKRVEQELRRAERLASIGTLAAGIAHEINNPLAGIRAAAERAFADRSGDASDWLIADALEDIQDEADRCGKVVESILGYARSETHEKTRQSINEVVQSAIQMTGMYAAEKGAVIEFVAGNDLPDVDINVLEMEHAFANILRNAIDSGKGVHVVVCTKIGDDGVVVTVNDNGGGIEEAALERVFDPFHSSHRATGGTGLGLSLAHTFITNHAGSIDVSSQVRRGTTVTIGLQAAG